MKTKGIDLGWIVVKDLKKAITFYTETVGLTLKSSNEAFGWAEMQGAEGGAHLGLAQISPTETDEPPPVPAGSNAVMTVTVSDIHEACKQLQDKGATMIGEIMEVPGHVKMQLFQDTDGNHCQFVEKLDQ